MSTSPWFSIRALAGQPAELRIFGEIGFEVEAASLIAALDALGDVPLDVRINSVGGSVIEGMHIYNRLRMHKAPVSVTIEGIAASMATIIACAGKPVRMADAGWYMIHMPAGVAIGSADAMRKGADVLDKMGQQLVDIYVQRTGKTPDEIAALMAAETWFSPAEALEHKFIDEVLAVDDDLKAAASLTGHDLSRFHNFPRTIPMTDSAIAAAEARGRQQESARRDEITAVFTGYQGFELASTRDACLADANCTADQARLKLLAEIKAQNDREVTPMRSTFLPRQRIEAPADFIHAATDTLLQRHGVRVANPHPAARDLHRMSLVEMAAASLRYSGVSTAGLPTQKIVGLAFSHSTSDFPHLLENVAGKALLEGYQAEEDTAAGWTRVAEVKDFKTQSRVRMGEAPSLLEVPEGAEFTEGSFSESRETYALSTFGRLFSITRQAVINDDLGSFVDVPRAFGASARRKELDLTWSVLTANAALSDGVALFHSGHNNLDATGDALSVASLGAAMAAMRLQKGVGGVQVLNLRPVFLLVPAELEVIAAQLLASLVDPSKSNATPVPQSIRSLQLVVDARLSANSATAWYLATSSDAHPCVERGYLDGIQAAHVEQQEGFQIDGVAFKCRIDVAAKALDFRGLYKNVGA